MPERFQRPCAYPGCPELIREGRFCAQHNREVKGQYDHNRESAAKRGYDHRWQAIRRMFLRRHPLCMDPFGVHHEIQQVVAATEVDHIKPKRDGGGNEETNLQALCKSCHSRKTMSELRAEHHGG